MLLVTSIRPHRIVTKVVMALVSVVGTGSCPTPADEPARKPAAIDLSHWKLTLPVDETGTSKGKAVEIQADQLVAGFQHADYFLKDKDGSLVFWSPVTGARTKGTDYSRSELREVPDPKDDNVTWTAHGSHVLDASCRVTKAPSSQKVIIGQIHSFSGAARPLVKLQYFKGRVVALIKQSPAKDTEQKLTFPEVGLNEEIHYQIKLQDGLLSLTVNGLTQTCNTFHKEGGWQKETFYFKAGAYCQDNEGPETEGARVVFSALEFAHSS